MSTKDWDQYNQNTMHNSPRELYLEAIKYVKAKRPIALDIGAGALNETKDMLRRGYTVTATDANPAIGKLASDLGSEQLTVHVSRMENYHYEKSAYDYINAMFSLPFINPKKFNNTFQDILKALKPSGIIAFHLFGSNDDWSSDPSMTFHTRVDIHELLIGWKIVRLKELDYVGKVADGQSKHCHIFQIIAKL